MYHEHCWSLIAPLCEVWHDLPAWQTCIVTQTQQYHQEECYQGCLSHQHALDTCRVIVWCLCQAPKEHRAHQSSPSWHSRQDGCCSVYLYCLHKITPPFVMKLTRRSGGCTLTFWNPASTPPTFASVTISETSPLPPEHLGTKCTRRSGDKSHSLLPATELTAPPERLGPRLHLFYF